MTDETSHIRAGVQMKPFQNSKADEPDQYLLVRALDRLPFAGLNRVPVSDVDHPSYDLLEIVGAIEALMPGKRVEDFEIQVSSKLFSERRSESSQHRNYVLKALNNLYDHLNNEQMNAADQEQKRRVLARDRRS